MVAGGVVPGRSPPRTKTLRSSSSPKKIHRLIDLLRSPSSFSHSVMYYALSSSRDSRETEKLNFTSTIRDTTRFKNRYSISIGGYIIKN